MGNDWRSETPKTAIRSSRKIAIEGTNTSCDGDKTHQTTQKSSQASKRPESACLQLPNDRGAAQYSHPLFIVGQPVPSSETPTPERHRARHACTKACLLHESCQSDLLRDNEAKANAAKEPARP